MSVKLSESLMNIGLQTGANLGAAYLQTRMMQSAMPAGYTQAGYTPGIAPGVQGGAVQNALYTPRVAENPRDAALSNMDYQGRLEEILQKISTANGGKWPSWLKSILAPANWRSNGQQQTDNANSFDGNMNGLTAARVLMAIERNLGNIRSMFSTNPTEYQNIESSLGDIRQIAGLTRNTSLTMFTQSQLERKLQTIDTAKNQYLSSGVGMAQGPFSPWGSGGVFYNQNGQVSMGATLLNAGLNGLSSWAYTQQQEKLQQQQQQQQRLAGQPPFKVESV